MPDNASYDSRSLQVIEWHMLDKRKFYPLSLACSICVRGALYPLTVVKTRLQIQKQATLYTGTVDAFRKIFASEGISGLYKGYWVNTMQIVSGIFYVTTYEKVRQLLRSHAEIENHQFRSLIGGGCASLVSQSIIVPFDVISQHLMMYGNVVRRQQVDRLGVLERVDFTRPKQSLAIEVIRAVYRKDGLRGFYRGYTASVLCYVPNSAMFWTFYMLYSEKFTALTPPWVSQLLLQCVAAPAAGITTTCLTNPMDLLRARLQVNRTALLNTLETLWIEERWRIFTKGLSARLISSCMFSTLIILGYETLKRLSVNPDYIDVVQW